MSPQQKRRECNQAQPLVINPVIYSELSVSYSTFDLLEAAINAMQLQFVKRHVKPSI